MKAIGVFALVLALASPALAGPANSTIGGKRLTNDNVHNVGVGYPSLFYEWWNKGPRQLDWALKGALVYGDWAAAYSRGRFIRVGLGLSAPLRSSSAQVSSPGAGPQTYRSHGESGLAPRSGV